MTKPGEHSRSSFTVSTQTVCHAKPLWIWTGRGEGEVSIYQATSMGQVLPHTCPHLIFPQYISFLFVIRPTSWAWQDCVTRPRWLNIVSIPYCAAQCLWTSSVWVNPSWTKGPERRTGNECVSQPRAPVAQRKGRGQTREKEANSSRCLKKEVQSLAACDSYKWQSKAIRTLLFVWVSH